MLGNWQAMEAGSNRQSWQARKCATSLRSTSCTIQAPGRQFGNRKQSLPQFLQGKFSLEGFALALSTPDSQDQWNAQAAIKRACLRHVILDYVHLQFMQHNFTLLYTSNGLGKCSLTQFKISQTTVWSRRCRVYMGF